MRQQHGHFQVHAKRVLDLRRCQLVERAGRFHARIIDQHVDTAKLAQCHRNQASALFCIAQIDVQNRRADTFLDYAEWSSCRPVPGNAASTRFIPALASAGAM